MKKAITDVAMGAGRKFTFGVLGEQPVSDGRWHMPAQFILAGKNRIKVRVSGQDYTLSAGDFLFVWPGEEFEVVSVPKKAGITLQFDSSAINECDDICAYYHYLDTVRILDGSCEKLRDEVASYFQHAYDSAEKQELFFETLVRIDIMKILIEAAKKARENSLAAQNVEPLRRNSGSKMEKACSYIIANCDKRITQAEVSEQVGISTFYFSRLFRQYSGQSFNDFLNEHRIRKALMLLSNRRISIQDVAINSGFQSISNFNKVFKKHVGVSPNEYRRIHDIRKAK